MLIKAWPTEYLVVTQTFDVNPQNYIGLHGHEGWDFRTNFSKVFSCTEGVVKIASFGKTYGNQVHVEVKLENTIYTFIYAHLDKILVKVGDYVYPNQILGISGNTGNSSGNHLHLTIKKQGAFKAKETPFKGDQIDPLPLFLEWAKDVRVKINFLEEYTNLNSIEKDLDELVKVNNKLSEQIAKASFKEKV